MPRVPIVAQIQRPRSKRDVGTPAKARCVGVQAKGDVLLEQERHRIGGSINEGPERDLVPNERRENDTVVRHRGH